MVIQARRLWDDSQILMLFNGDRIEVATSLDQDGFLDQIVAANRTNRDKINALIWQLARWPSMSELRYANPCCLLVRAKSERRCRMYGGPCSTQTSLFKITSEGRWSMDRESYQSLAYWRRSRRHFLSHLRGLALSTPFASFTNSLRAMRELRKQHKSAILLWMGGGPGTMDIWDLKPGQATGGPFKQIATSVDGIAISEHMPMTAKQMHHLAIVR